MATVRNFEVISEKFNVETVCVKRAKVNTWMKQGWAMVKWKKDTLRGAS
jgi:hypothetical protein